MHVGPVYWTSRSEPHASLALAWPNPRAGVTMAEVNLKALRQGIRTTTVGHSGQACVVDGRGRLIAHRGEEPMRRATDLSRLPQVQAALKDPATRGPVEGSGVDTRQPGSSAVSVHAAAPTAGWRVFVDLPLAEARVPLWRALGSFAGMLGIALLAAVLASRVTARRQLRSQTAAARGSA